MNKPRLAVSGHQTSHVRFTFPKPLDDPSHVWLDRDLKAVKLPALGESLELEE